MEIFIDTVPSSRDMVFDTDIFTTKYFYNIWYDKAY